MLGRRTAQQGRRAASIFIRSLAPAGLLALAASGCGDDIEGSAPGKGKRGTVRLEKIGKFSSPLYVTQPKGDDDLLFVVQKAGQVRVLDAGKLLPKPFLDLRKRVKSGGVEQGLLSLAFAPDFLSTGRFYVEYVNRRGDEDVVEFRTSQRDLLKVRPSTARKLLTISDPAPIHNGGLLLFGPDRRLYIATGDGGISRDPHRTAQNRRSFLGKILRINPHPRRGKPYAVPRTNPFARGSGWDEIFAYGLRNPWRFSFDRKTGDLWVGDVGQDFWEEVNFRPAKRAAGSNFGWSAYEGNVAFNRDQAKRARGSVRPQLVYRHGPSCSVTGGYVVRDRSLPSLYGRYLYGDFCTGELRSFIPGRRKGKARDDRPLGLKVPALASFGEDNNGHIYAVSLSGPVYRLKAK